MSGHECLYEWRLFPELVRGNIPFVCHIDFKKQFAVRPGGTFAFNLHFINRRPPPFDLEIIPARAGNPQG